MRKVFLVLSLVSLFAVRLGAEEPGLKVPTVVFLSAAAGDWTTTAYGHTHGLQERNPYLAPMQNHPALMIAVGASQDVATALVVNKLIGKHHPKIAAGIFYSLTAYRSYLIIHNVQQATTIPVFVRSF